jgi:hypothetical protein
VYIIDLHRDAVRLGAGGATCAKELSITLTPSSAIQRSRDALAMAYAPRR